MYLISTGFDATPKPNVIATGAQPADRGRYLVLPYSTSAASARRAIVRAIGNPTTLK